ncbi:hypothetical protein GW17_00004402 [Ensete ventricosum]|nr:hypothetical protein GW17_00004402 [Ensete ventricosum]
MKVTKEIGSIEGEKGKKKKKKKKKRRKKKRRRRKPSAVLARAQSPPLPVGSPRTVAARGSPARRRVSALARFFSRARRRNVSPLGEKDRATGKARTAQYIPVRQLIGTRTARERLFSPRSLAARRSTANLTVRSSRTTFLPAQGGETSPAQGEIETAFAILTCTARYGRYISVRQVTDTRTAHYRAVPPKIDHRQSISAVLARRKKKRKRRKKEAENTSPTRRPRPRVVHGSPAPVPAIAFSPARGERLRRRRRNVFSPRNPCGEKKSPQ